MNRNSLIVFVIASALMLGANDLTGADIPGLARLEKPADADAPMEITADKLVYEEDGRWLEARGNVVIVMGGDELRADYVRVNTSTRIAFATGNVVLKQKDTVLRGKSVRYDARTRTGDWVGLEGSMEPFYVLESGKMEKVRDDGVFKYVIRDTVITTCNKKHHQHYRVGAKYAELVPGHHLKVRGATWYFGPVPVLYVPFWYRILKEDFGFRFYPGHSSRMGTFLLSSVRYRVNPGLKGETHFDVRSERGVALGQDFIWNFGKTLNHNGDIAFYRLDDQKPVDDDEDAETADIENSRYRFKIRHEYNPGPRDQLLLNAHYLSDTDVLEDFFEDEYRDRSQPDNFINYTRRGDSFTAGIIARGRLNDFYTTVNRLPECYLNIMRQRAGNTAFYYESETAFAALEKVWKKSSDNEDYDSLRFDTLHTISRPSKHFGFLNLIPRAGWRGTWYSRTRETITVEEFADTGDAFSTNGVSTNASASAVVPVEKDIDASADFRNVVQFGLKVSWKAFKTWGLLNPRRHVVEPYADYRIRPEPVLTEENLYQFDEADDIAEDHSIRLGVRNKFQVKKDNRPLDVVDVDVHTTWNLDPDEDEDPVETIAFDGELKPSSRLSFDFDGEYGVDDSRIETFNIRAGIDNADLWNVGGEYRFSDDDNDVLSADITAMAGNRWTWNAYGRYILDDARWEEQGGYLQRNLDCMKIRTGVVVMPGYTRSDGAEADDEWKISVEMWLTAFPNVGFSGKHRN